MLVKEIYQTEFSLLLNNYNTLWVAKKLLLTNVKTVLNPLTKNNLIDTNKIRNYQYGVNVYLEFFRRKSIQFNKKSWSMLL